MGTSTGLEQLTTQNKHAKLTEGWRIVRFGDVVRNVDVSERDPLAKGIERYIGLDHLDPESLHIKRWGLIEEGTSFSRKFVTGQVLFGKRRAYQRKAAIAEFDGICSGDILVFEAKDDLLPELLPFIVQSNGFFEHALNTSAGSLSPRTKWKDLAAYEFALPLKDEQRRIADILWAADDLIQKYSSCYFTLDTLQTTMSNFLLGVPEQCRLLDASNCQVPKDKKMMYLGEIIEVKHGFAFSSEYFSDVATNGTAPLTGERAQASLRGRPRSRLGKEGSGNGCLRGRPRGRFGITGSQAAPLRLRLVCFGSIQGGGAIL